MVSLFFMFHVGFLVKLLVPRANQAFSMILRTNRHTLRCRLFNGLRLLPLEFSATSRNGFATFFMMMAP